MLHHLYRSYIIFWMISEFSFEHSRYSSFAIETLAIFQKGIIYDAKPVIKGYSKVFALWFGKNSPNFGELVWCWYFLEFLLLLSIYLSILNTLSFSDQGTLSDWFYHRYFQRLTFAIWVSFSLQFFLSLGLCLILLPLFLSSIFHFTVNNNRFLPLSKEIFQKTPTIVRILMFFLYKDASGL